MKILVCGGRAFTDKECVFKFLDLYLDKVTLIISGAARGADRLSVEWAKANKIPYKEYPADWDKYKKAAGYIRNTQMLVEGKPDLVIAFPGGRGTADMKRQTTKAGVKIVGPMWPN